MTVRVSSCVSVAKNKNITAEPQSTQRLHCFFPARETKPSASLRPRAQRAMKKNDL
jgi:hypothetical protein